MSAFEHVHGAQTEAEDVELASLARALPIAFTINELFIITALVQLCSTRLDASAIMIDHAIGADGCAHVALSNHEAGRALREPLVLALLALAALLFLAVSTPQ